MKSFDDLTYLGRIRRLRQLAQAALAAYGLSDARLSLLRVSANALFRVWEASPTLTGQSDRYTPGQYLLRVHFPGLQTPEALEMELAWQAAMCREAGLPVPEPVPARDGSLLPEVTIPGIPGPRHCSLLRWLNGRLIQKNIRPAHYRAQGQLLARLHNFSAKWQSPAGIRKKTYDWDGLFRDDSGTGIPASEAWAYLPGEYLQPFQVVASKIKQVMEAWGKNPAIYGLIHGDLCLSNNVLFLGGEARAIDFDDSGFGYYEYDLGVALGDCQEDAALPLFREALLEGYTQVRPLPEEQIQNIDLFLAASLVYWTLRRAANAHRFPANSEGLYRTILDGLYQRMEEGFRLVKRILAKG